MKRLCFAVACMLGSVALGQTGGPPSYSAVRWDEDYSYLREAEARTDLWDPIKYIPLNNTGDMYLSLGGQVRYRYEFWDDANFGAGQQDGSGFHLLRVLAHADLHLGDNFRVFLQGKTALEHDRDGGPRATDEDRLAIQQAFADVKMRWDDGSLLLRLGRQDLIYGAQRIISPLDWANVRRTFQGGRASLTLPGQTFDVFLVQPVIVDREHWNENDDDTTFAGLYYTRQMPDIFGADARSKLEAYLLGLFRRPGDTDEDRYTIGGRFSTNPKPWDLDIELMYQFGEIDDDSISAWAVAIEGGHMAANCPLKPRVFLGFDIASGGDPDERFNQLFPLGHAYFGYIDAIGRQNIIDVHPGMVLTLSRDVNVRVEQHFFWRQDTGDAVYNAAGGVLRAGASDERYVGSELDILLNWKIDRHLSAYAGFSYFFAGGFIEDTGDDEDVAFVYGAVTYSF